MSLAGFLPDPTNQGKDHQGRVEDEEKDVQEGIHQWGIAERLRFQVHPPQQVVEARVVAEGVRITNLEFPTYLDSLTRIIHA